MDLYRDYAIAPARHVAALWYRLGRYLSYAIRERHTGAQDVRSRCGAYASSRGWGLGH